MKTMRGKWLLVTTVVSSTSAGLLFKSCGGGVGVQLKTKDNSFKGADVRTLVTLSTKHPSQRRQYCGTLCLYMCLLS